MRGLDHQQLASVTNHPLQLNSLTAVQRLLQGLDACASPADLYEFQRDLFTAIHTVETRRAGCSQAGKRIRQGKSPRPDAPDLPAGADPNDLHSWNLEVFIAERVARQLRVVGDGLAWKAFEYDRRPIYALSRNESPGPMVGKIGLESEVGMVQALWHDQQHFGLLHDLTTCLRISDVTEFAGNRRVVHEVKTKRGRVVSTQKARAQAAIDAIRDGGELPGADPDTRLVALETGYLADLPHVGGAIQLARQNGVRGVGLPEGRMVFASSILDVLRIHHENIAAAPAARQAAFDDAVKDAGIGGTTNVLVGASSDRAGRFPLAAPVSIFPLSAADRAALICDYVTYQLVMSVDVLASLLEERGLHVRIRPLSAHEELETSTNVLDVRRGRQKLSVTRVGLDPVLFEAMRPSNWCDGVTEVLNLPRPPACPALIWRDDASSWRSELFA